jgi:hypothetical protein
MKPSVVESHCINSSCVGCDMDYSFLSGSGNTVALW